MILLLGSTGYVGSAFNQLLQSRGETYRGISRQQIDYTDRDTLIGLIRETRASFLINAAGYTGKPNVDACDAASSRMHPWKRRLAGCHSRSLRDV